MKTVLGRAAALALACSAATAAPPPEAPTAQYDSGGRLLRPADYRDWEFLSAGYGMNYDAAPGGHELFTNVFVQRWAYQAFLRSGRWPERTMFVIDERNTQSQGSINKTGHFQTELAGLAVEIKDAERNGQVWAYYTFGADQPAAAAQPAGNACWACHERHAAVEHSFVQFYPTLKPVARKFGVYDERRERVHDAE
jgi:hypothetical protein